MACITFNLQMTHQPAELNTAIGKFRGLIDLAIAHGGTYCLTYHRYATDRQLRTCYPEFDACLKEKLQFHPETKFWSDWLGHANPMACG
jgi:hypothetical protein